MKWSVAKYNAAERKAFAELPNRVVQASMAVTFQYTVYPYRVESAAELWRFADVMHENKLEKTFKQLGGLSDHEFAHVEAITKIVAGLTRKRVVPGAAMLRAIVAYRAISALNPKSVVEIGPGCGYLGAMLMRDGIDYAATDVSQAFFLWQAQLFEEIGKPYRLIPWWEWFLITEINADVFTANHVLNEMAPLALRFVINLVSRSRNRFFVAENIGGEVIRRSEQTEKLFSDRGWLSRDFGGARLFSRPPYIGEFSTPRLTKKWADLCDLWGGVPETEDEKFLGLCA